MGFWFTSRAKLVSGLADHVGYKAGLALTRAELVDAAEAEDRDTLAGPGAQILRIRAEEYEEILAGLLYGVGNIESPDTTPRSMRMLHQLRDRPRELEIYNQVFARYVDWLNKAVRGTARTLDPAPFVDWARTAHGLLGLGFAIELIKEINERLHRSPWSSFRHLEWKDVAELTELFDSENITPTYGSFLDQRFIDFLAQNDDAIDRMNWRKFEALTCEFFARMGYHVEIGPGRDDGGVDARIWKADADTLGPPLVIVQCKRQKADVEQVVVKALWADVVEEGAESGLVVCSTRVAPGAKAVRDARAYPVYFAERPTIRKWLWALKSVGSGIFEPGLL